MIPEISRDTLAITMLQVEAPILTERTPARPSTVKTGPFPFSRPSQVKSSPAMRAALHRAAKTGTPDRARDLAAGSRRAHRATPRSGAHASRWCVDELPEHTPRPPRLRAERRARRKPFSSRTRVGPSELYGYDAHGNIAFLTDVTGAETATYTYDAWGNLVEQTGATPNTRLYVGEEYDSDVGAINLRSRYYKPATGRLLSH